MRGVKRLVVLSVGTLYLTVMSWRISLFLLCVQDVSCSDKDLLWNEYNSFCVDAPGNKRGLYWDDVCACDE